MPTLMEESLTLLRKGDYLTKLGHNLQYSVTLFQLSQDDRSLRYRSDRKQFEVPLLHILSIEAGRTSKVFAEYDKKYKTLESELSPLAQTSFTIRYTRPSSKKEDCFSITCKGNEAEGITAHQQFDLWYNGLRTAVQSLRAAENAGAKPSRAFRPPTVQIPSGDMDRSVSDTASFRKGDSVRSSVSYPNLVNAHIGAYRQGAPSGVGDPFYFGCPLGGCNEPVPERDPKKGAQKEKVQAVRLPGASVMDAAQAAASDTHALLLTRGGDVFTWGGPGYQDEHCVRKVEGLAQHRCREVACAVGASLALTDRGTVMAWGHGSTGMLGNSTAETCHSPKPIRNFIWGPGSSVPSTCVVPIKQIAAGPHHCAAISGGSQQLFTWGDGACGRLGHGDMHSCYEPRQVTALAELRVIRVACGTFHSAVICTAPGGTDFDMSIDALPEDASSHSYPLATTPQSTRKAACGQLYTWGGMFVAPQRALRPLPQFLNAKQPRHGASAAGSGSVSAPSTPVASPPQAGPDGASSAPTLHTGPTGRDSDTPSPGEVAGGGVSDARGVAEHVTMAGAGASIQTSFMSTKSGEAVPSSGAGPDAAPSHMSPGSGAACQSPVERAGSQENASPVASLSKLSDSNADDNGGCLGHPDLPKRQGVLIPRLVKLSNVCDCACGENFTIAVDVYGRVHQMGSMGVQAHAEHPWEGARTPTLVAGALTHTFVTYLAAGRHHVIALGYPHHETDANGVATQAFSWGRNDHGQLGRDAPLTLSMQDIADGKPDKRAIPALLHVVTSMPVFAAAAGPATSLLVVKHGTLQPNTPTAKTTKRFGMRTAASPTAVRAQSTSRRAGASESRWLSNPPRSRAASQGFLAEAAAAVANPLSRLSAGPSRPLTGGSQKRADSRRKSEAGVISVAMSNENFSPSAGSSVHGAENLLFSRKQSSQTTDGVEWETVDMETQSQPHLKQSLSAKGVLRHVTSLRSPSLGRPPLPRQLSSASDAPQRGAAAGSLDTIDARGTSDGAAGAAASDAGTQQGSRALDNSARMDSTGSFLRGVSGGASGLDNSSVGVESTRSLPRVSFEDTRSAAASGPDTRLSAVLSNDASDPSSLSSRSDAVQHAPGARHAAPMQLLEDRVSSHALESIGSTPKEAPLQELLEERKARRAAELQVAELRAQLAEALERERAAAELAHVRNPAERALHGPGPHLVDTYSLQISEGVHARVEVREVQNVRSLKFSSALYRKDKVRAWWAANKGRIESGDIFSGRACEVLEEPSFPMRRSPSQARDVDTPSDPPDEDDDGSQVSPDTSGSRSQPASADAASRDPAASSRAANAADAAPIEGNPGSAEHALYPTHPAVGSPWNGTSAAPLRPSRSPQDAAPGAELNKHADSGVQPARTPLFDGVQPLGGLGSARIECFEERMTRSAADSAPPSASALSPAFSFAGGASSKRSPPPLRSPPFRAVPDDASRLAARYSGYGSQSEDATDVLASVCIV